MIIEQIRQLQQAIIHHVFFSEYWFYQFQQIQKTIPIEIFGQYKNLMQVAIGKTYEEISIDKISTEIVKAWLSMQITEIMSIPFSIPNFYDDLKILIQHFVMGKPGDDFEKLTQVQSIFTTLEEKRAFDASKKYMILELYDEAIADLVEKQDRKDKWLTLGYSTGFHLLDMYTEWIQKGTVMRLNAYSNVGKSKFSYQIANKLLEQKAHVLYFSLEVPKRTVIYNMIANKYKMPISDVYKMKFDDIDFGELFRKKLEIIDDKYDLSEIVQYTEMRKPDAIIIDFVQNIRSDGKSEYERMTNTAVTIQQLAIKNNIAVFDLSQISNAGTDYAQGDAIPSKGSGALVASADVGLMIKRDKLVNDKIVLHIAKNKFGQNGKSIDYDVDFSRWVFTEKGESLSNF
jgi:replicative DNA helicase